MKTMIDTQEVLQKYINSHKRLPELEINIPTFSVFFDPKSGFVHWMREFCQDKTVVDCGCGRGQTTAVLRHSGLNVVAIDLNGADCPLIKDIHFMDAVFFPYSPNYVAMMCRPCRGEWIHATIVKAIESGAKFVYVGKEEHYNADLAPLPYKVERVLTDAGLQNESVWVISKED